jgi:exonuclease VII small subunit
MVINLSDINHLSVMANLSNRQPQPTEINVKTLLGTDTTNDPSLSENILKLCAQLRSEGFVKHANDLEDKFANYTKSATSLHLYKVHKEDGEALLERAHPDGDVKICDDVSDELGTVETKLSRHKKILDIVRKEPTGKLGAYVEYCKVALGLDNNRILNIKKLLQRASFLIKTAIKKATQGGDLYNITLGSMQHSSDHIAEIATTFGANNNRRSMFEDAKSELNEIMYHMEPGFLKGVGDKDLYAQIKNLFDRALRLLKTAENKYQDLVLNEQDPSENEDGQEEGDLSEGADDPLVSAVRPATSMQRDQGQNTRPMGDLHSQIESEILKLNSWQEALETNKNINPNKASIGKQFLINMSKKLELVKTQAEFTEIEEALTSFYNKWQAALKSPQTK